LEDLFEDGIIIRPENKHLLNDVEDDIGDIAAPQFCQFLGNFISLFLF